MLSIKRLVGTFVAVNEAGCTCHRFCCHQLVKLVCCVERTAVSHHDHHERHCAIPVTTFAFRSKVLVVKQL